ncbi:hypothetical protein M3Y98_00560400 [Aphelenchoides besseyi]|nr:hypothetical protein M3Y98_00560400 [Aphelenchoides besseyi]KAI6193665.1 hypothetical protein M3Y96_01042800 [Aphelenchoides besseyi]
MAAFLAEEDPDKHAEQVLNAIPFFRIAFIGDKGSGKSEVRRAYIQLSTASDKLVKLDSNTTRVRGRQVELITVDRTSELKKVPHMNHCSHLDCIILFYNVTSPAQFFDIHNKWAPLVKELYPTTSLLICATGIEARCNRSERFRRLQQGFDSLIDSELCVDTSSTTTSPSTTSTNPTATSSTNSLASSTTSADVTAEISTPPLSSPFAARPIGSLADIPGLASASSPAVADVFSTHKSKRRGKRGYSPLISTHMGHYLSQYVHASAFREISTKTLEGVEDLMDTAIRTINEVEGVKHSLARRLVGQPLPRDSCVIM